MNTTRFTLLFFFMIFIQGKVFSANRYWVGGSGNWTTTSHWAATSGGATDNILPTSSDYIYIDANSGNGTITTNTAIVVYSIDFDANCSNIILDITSNTFTVTTDIYQNTSAINGTIQISGGTLTVNGNINVYDGTFQADSGTINVNGNSFYIAGGTTNFAGATVNIGNSTNEYLRLYSGTLNITSGTINITDYFYVDNNGLFVTGGTVNIGTGMAEDYIPLYISGSGNFSGGTINITSVQSNGYATYINSSSTFTGGLIQITATDGDYYIFSEKSHNFEINSTGVNAIFAVDATFSGDFTLTNGTADISGSTITVAGQTYLNGGIFEGPYGTLNCNGSGVALAINGATANFSGATINVGDGTDEILRIYSGSINVTAGTINVKNYVMIDVNGSTFSGGTINAGTGGAVSYSAFYLFGTGNFSGGIIDVQSVQTGGSGIAIDISSGSTFTGGLMKVTATNANYSIYTRKAFHLEINSATKTATLPTSMRIYGDLTVTAGSLIAIGGTTSFLGSSSQSILGTSATQITLYNATLNNSNGLTIAPSSGIATTILYTLTMTNGKITLGNYSLNIGATGISGSISSANASNYIVTNGTGVLKQYNIGTGQRTSAFYPIGINSSSYNPITLSVSGTSTVDDFGIRVAQDVLLNGNSGAAYTTDAVNKTWFISEGTATGSSIAITPQWNLSDELSSFTRSLAEVRHYTSSWISEGGAGSSGAGPFTITSSAITSFSIFSIFDGTVLPIVLLDFNATRDNENVNIAWSTLSESNNDYFTVLKSQDGINFENIGEIDGKGNSGTKTNYSLIDRNPFYGISYYKLSQTDFDGKTTYTDLKSVVFENKTVENLLFPNPSNGNLIYINIPKNEENQTITIYNNLGQLILAQETGLVINKTITIEFYKKLTPGNYSVNVKSRTSNWNEKLIIQ